MQNERDYMKTSTKRFYENDRTRGIDNAVKKCAKRKEMLYEYKRLYRKTIKFPWDYLRLKKLSKEIDNTY